MAPSRVASLYLAAVAACAPQSEPGPEPERRPEPGPNVLLVVVDTLAAEHMAPYGYDRVTTPELDALATRGILFQNAYSTAPWTLPSHASMFTGLVPAVHGATQEHLVLHAGHETLAEALHGIGYRTFAAVTNPVLNPGTGIGQGFEVYRTLYAADERTRIGGGELHPVSAAFQSFLNGLAAGEPFFAFVNFIEPHARYQPPDELATRFLRGDRELGAARAVDGSWARYYLGESTLDEQAFGLLADLYDAELARASRNVGELVELLEQRGLGSTTLVIVTSDHGENLGDHGHLDHVFSLHDTLLRVPLFVFGPGVPSGRVEAAPVSTLDVHATILAAAGSRAPHGIDLLRARHDPDRALTSEYHYPLQVLSVLRAMGYEGKLERLDPYRRRLRSVRKAGWKLVLGSDGACELYRVADDPRELVNRAATEPAVVAELKRLLFVSLADAAAFVAEPQAPPTQPFEGVDDATLRELRSLGYVAGER